MICALVLLGFVSKASYLIEGYKIGPAGDDCVEWFIVMYWVNTEGEKIYQGSAKVKIGEGCPPIVQGVYDMTPGSLVDFNDLSGYPEMELALNEWLAGAITANKASNSENSNSAIIYRGRDGDYVIRMVTTEQVELGNLKVFSAKGELALSSDIIFSDSLTNELVCPEIKNLPAGVYFALIPIQGSEGMELKQVKFVVN